MVFIAERIIRFLTYEYFSGTSLPVKDNSPFNFCNYLVFYHLGLPCRLRQWLYYQQYRIHLKSHI